MDVVTKPAAQEEADPKQPRGALRKCLKIPKISSAMNQVQEQNSGKTILENPEVFPSPSLIRSWLKFLLMGHQSKGIHAL